MRNITCLILFFGFGFFTNGQSSLQKSVSDSLWLVWITPEQPDTNRLMAIHNYALNGYLFTQPDSAFYFAQLQYDFALDKGLKKNMASACYIQGLANARRGENYQALIYYEKSLKLYEEIGDQERISVLLNNIGVSYWNLGDFTKSLFYNTESLRIKEERNDLVGMAYSLNNIGGIHFAQGNYDEAVKWFSESLKIRKEIGDQKGISSLLNNIGLIYQAKGDYAQALIYHFQSLKARTEFGDKIGVASSLNNLGVIFRIQGDTSQALNYYSQSLTIRTELGDKQGMASVLNNIGVVYKNQDHDKAIRYYNESLKIYEEIGDLKGKSAVLHNIGIILFDQEEWMEAINYFSKSLEIKEEIGDKEGMAISLNSIGEIYAALGDYNKSLNYSEKSLAIALEMGSPKTIKNASRSLFVTQHFLKNYNAVKLHLSAIYTILQTGIQSNYFTLSENEKQNYFTTLESDFGLYHDFALYHQDKFDNLTDTSYNIALQNKGLALKSSSAMRFAIQNSGDSLLIGQYGDWLALKIKISKINQTDSTYKSLTNQANEMEHELVKKSTIFSDFDKVKSLKWQDVQLGLKPNEAAIEFVHFKSEIDTSNPIVYAALIIKEHSKNPEMVRLCTEADLKEIVGVFQGNNLSFVGEVYGTKSKAEKALYEKIWQPMESYLQNVKTVYYSPSGLLHKVSFASICKGQDLYLSDVYDFRQMGSTGNLAFDTSTDFDELENFLLMGGVQFNSDSTEKEIWNYLPGSLAETDAINMYLQKKKFGVNYFKENNASESIFKEKISSSSIVHIATHGFFFPDPDQVREEMKSVNESEGGQDMNFRGTTNYANWSFVNNKNPLMRSGIVLANANDVWSRDPLSEGEDGILTAQEVSNLDLRNTKLVVLSACETGLGDIKGSEGVFGLQRAFKMAGVKYLIMSLWQVPDKETSEFMILFYKNLIKLKDIPTAFQKTQKVMREKYDPYYWGAFVLIE